MTLTKIWEAEIGTKALIEIKEIKNEEQKNDKGIKNQFRAKSKKKSRRIEIRQSKVE